MKHVALGAIRLYQFTLSPILGSSCRFHPTCSRYAYEAIDRYGILRGLDGVETNRTLPAF